MTLAETYASGKLALGVGSDIYGAWSTGQQYEARSESYRRDALLEIQRNKDSFNIQQDAKDAAEFGGAVMADAYLDAGAKRINAITDSLTATNNQLLLQGDIAYEQSLAVDETVGNMMSRNAVDAMKAEARLRTSAASTGTSGGTTAQATYEARSVQQFDNAVLIGRANSKKLNINRRLQMDRISAKNKKKYMASELATVMGAQGAGAAYMAGYDKAYAGLDKSFKEGYIGYDKVQVEDTTTWMDTLLDYKDVIINSGLDDAATRYFAASDFENCGGNISCQEETKKSFEATLQGSKGVSLAQSDVIKYPWEK